MLEHVVFEWRDALDILLVAFLLYQVIQLLLVSLALTVLTGLGLLTLLYFISRSMALYTLTWLLQHVFSSLFLLIVVIFQSDIRQALGEIGTNNLFRKRALQHWPRWRWRRIARRTRSCSCGWTPCCHASCS